MQTFFFCLPKDYFFTINFRFRTSEIGPIVKYKKQVGQFSEKKKKWQKLKINS